VTGEERRRAACRRAGQGTEAAQCRKRTWRTSELGRYRHVESGQALAPGLHPQLLGDPASDSYALGRAHRRTGKWHAAQKHRTTSRAMYREMDMRFWLEKAEAEMHGRG
jgi:hypothetical protein